MKLKNNRHFWAMGLTLATLALGWSYRLQAQPPKAPVKITSAVLCTSYVNGKVKGVATTFKPSDRTIHCVVKFNKITKASLRFTWIAVDAAGLKNYKILDNSTPLQLVDTGHFTATLPRNWPVGKYKADIYYNKTWLRSVSCKIQ